MTSANLGPGLPKNTRSAGVRSRLRRPHISRSGAKPRDEAHSTPFESLTVTTDDGARLAVYRYESEGANEHTPTVIFAHGWTLSHESWLPVARRLVSDGLGQSASDATPVAPSSDGGVRLLLWDQRGHGSSTFASGKRTVQAQTVRALGDDLGAVLKLVPEQSPVVLAGHSMGGMTVMAFAGLHPDVVEERVAGVVLVSTASGELRGPGLPGEVALMRALSRVPLRLGPAVRPRSQSRTAFGSGARLEDMAETARQIGSTRLATTGAFYAALMAHDEMASLPALDAVGTTILCGTKDRLTPLRLSKRLAEAMPNAELRVMEGKGHMLTYEATDAVVEAIRERAVGRGAHEQDAMS